MRMASSAVSASSFGVFWRLAPSTRWIMRSRKLSPGSAVTRTSSRSEINSVPAVTVENISVPGCLSTGADSPVMANSFTKATPSTTSPSAGMSLVPLDRGRGRPYAALRQSPALSYPKRPSDLPSVLSLVRRSEAALALPRHSASASAKFANQTVNSKITVTTPL